MGSSILQAILGGVAGGAEGISQVREQRRLEEERRREAEERQRMMERQTMLDQAAFAERGWTTPEARTAKLRGAAPGIQSVMESAASMLGGGAPKRLDMPSLQQGAGMYGAPSGEITVGGRRLVLPETSMARQAREAAFERGERRFETEQERRREETETKLERERSSGLVQEARSKGRNSAAAAALLAENPTAYRELFPEAPEVNWQTMTDREGNVVQINPRTGATRRIEGVEAPIPGGRAGAGGKTGAQLKSEIPLPTLMSNLDSLRKMSDKDVTKLSPFNVYNAVSAPLLMAKGDVAGYGMGAIANVMSDEKSRAYATIIRAATDAVARASEVGILTNQDIARYQGQVTPLPGDTPNDLRRKHNNLMMWTEWLANNKQAIDTENPSIATPLPADDITEDYPFAASFIRNARAQGDSDTEIRRFLEAQQGRRR